VDSTLIKDLGSTMKNTSFRLLFPLCLIGFSTPQHAQISQVPLITGTAPVPPNLIFTIDDSGSMSEECIPDNLCGSAASLSPMSLVSSNKVVSSNPAFVMTRRSRSVAINSQYYNPAVTYTPWLKADGSYFPTYPPTAAPSDPRTPTTTLNLVANQTFSQQFCVPINVTTLTSNVCNAATETFTLAHYYNLTSGNGTSANHFTRVNIDSASAPFPKAPNRSDCNTTPGVCTLVEEQQNFSNWFVFSRNKIFAAIGGTATAFYSVPPDYRFGYGSINQGSSYIDGVNTQTIKRGLRPFSGTDKANFYTWLHNLTLTGGTPLRRAMGDVGEYFSRADNAGPWGATPGINDPTPHLACRRSFHILMTDGRWNGDQASNIAARSNVDNTVATTVITNPYGSTFQYTPTRPFRDSNANMLADVAMFYWVNDLRPDLANLVKPSGDNPAFWQNMVNYTIAFGQNGNLTYPTDLPALRGDVSPPKDWGTNEIDDLWHSAINSRGLYASAADQKSYSDAISTIINSIDNLNSSDAGIAVSSKVLSTGTRKYSPEYATNVWSGDITAIALDSQTGSSTGVVWRASENIPAPVNRSIFTFKDSTTRGFNFTWVDLTAQGMAASLGVSASEGPGLVSYLRGDRSGEGTIYRARAKVLGDIINSSPASVKDSLDMQYDFLSAGTSGKSTYREFLRNKKYREGQIFVGSNDGMLHAFAESTGIETFAFVPRTVLNRVKALSIAPYDHRYFVDGPIAEADIYDSSQSGTGWRNLVIGSGGAGAKNVFAVNIPVPRSPDGNAALVTRLLPPAGKDILWEINNYTDGFNELGYLLHTPETGIMRDGQWVVIFGNGYESASGKAQLFIVNAVTGALIKRIDTGIPSSGGGNGLGGVRLVRDSARRVVAAYAGDLRGNLWKFDLSGSTAASWAVAFSGTSGPSKPLFTALNRNGQVEPITAAPAYISHPLGGVQVLVGTGKLFERIDTSNVQERTLYGLWDKVTVGANSSVASDAIASNATLTPQQVAGTVNFAIGTPPQTVTYYTSTSNTVDYATQRGWRLPLTIQPGQRVTYDPLVDRGLVFFETIIPSAAAATCESSGSSGFNFALDPFTGAAQAGRATFDTNADGIIDARDDASAVIYQNSADGSDAILSQRGGSSRGILVGNGSPRLFQGSDVKLKRSWRQLFSPPN
jgi:type IV pilus assembly protein PilY1